MIAELALIVGQVVSKPIEGSWPLGLPPRQHGLSRLVGLDDPGYAGKTLCAVGRVRDDGSFWVQPLILGEPPRLCSWSPAELAFTSREWRKRTVMLLRRRLADRRAWVTVLTHRSPVWTVRLATEPESGSFYLPYDPIRAGFARARDRTDPGAQRVMEDAKAHRRRMFARR